MRARHGLRTRIRVRHPGMQYPGYDEAEGLTIEEAVNRIAKRWGISAGNLWRGAEITIPDFDICIQRGGRRA